MPSRRFLVVVALVGLGLGMTAPLTVLFATSLGAGPVAAGFAVSSIAVSLLVVDLFGSTWVPRLPGRTLIWASLTVFGVGALLSAGAPSLPVMIAARVFQGLGAAVFMSGGLHVVVRSVPASRAGASIGSFNAAWFGGIACGPLIGGGVAQLLPGQAGYRLAFLVSAAVCFLVAGTARLALPVLPSSRRPRLSWPRVPAARDGARIAPPLTLATVGQLVRGSLVPTVVPLLATGALGLGVGAVGVALSVLSVVDVLTMRYAGLVADRAGRRPILVVGFLVGALACALVPLVSGTLGFAAWCALLAIGLGVTNVVPTTMVVDVADDTEAAIAGFRILSDGAQLVGPVGAGALVGAAGPVGAVLAVGAVFTVTGLGALRTPETRTAETGPHRTLVTAPP
ncbi:MFS transporter [Cellulomonas hominis]